MLKADFVVKTVIVPLILSFIIYRFLIFLVKRFLLSKSIPWPALRANGNGWAIVTGATDGIGREFVKQLILNRGMRVLMLGRSEAKLKDVLGSLGTKAKAAIDYYVMDFSTATNQDWIKLGSKLQALFGPDKQQLSILVNCAGLSHDHPKYLEEETQDQVQAIIKVNALAPILLTQLCLPLMQSGRALIWNIGSMSADLASPLLATYAASKSFLKTLSQALAMECKEKGIQVQLLNTYFVTSKMSKKRKITWDTVSPEQYVQATLQGRLGGGDGLWTPVLSHALIEEGLSLVPKYILNNATLKVMKATRRKALSKKN